MNKHQITITQEVVRFAFELQLLEVTEREDYSALCILGPKGMRRCVAV